MKLGKLHEALLEAGASKAAADGAATEVATYENRLAAMEARLSSIDLKVTLIYPLTFAIVFKLFLH